MLFAQFLNSKWRWVALAIGVIFAVLLLTQLFDYGQAWRTRHATARQVEAAEAAHAAGAAAEPGHRHHFDSTFFELAGQHREAVRTGTIHQKSYDSLRALFPAAQPELPAQPPRYRAGH